MAAAPPPGLHVLRVGSASRQPMLYVPPGLTNADPATLVLTLHGAGGTAQSGLAHLQPLADANGLLLLAPQSRSATWDVITGGWGSDAATIDRALDAVFSSWAVDPGRVVISGFSDGASYALSLGLANGDLFTHVVAFSPGFVAPGPRVGAPKVYVSHGVRDTVLPIASTTRRLVPRLRESGYDLTVREFDGGHTVPPELTADAMRWLTET